MRLIDRIRGALGFGPRLRNKPNSMCWIRGVGAGAGAEALNGRAVKTVRITDSGLWEIEPPQRFIATRDCLFGVSRSSVERGEVVVVLAVHDDLLEPWREIGDDAQDESRLYLPPVPTHTTAKDPSHAA